MTIIASNCKSFRFFPRIKPFVLQNYGLRFLQQGINWHSCTRKKICNTQRMHLVPQNRNLWGQTSQTLNRFLNRPDIETRFPSKRQLLGFLLSKFQSTVSIVYKMIRYPCFFHVFFQHLLGLKVPKFCICFLLPCLRNNLFTVTSCISPWRRQSKIFEFWFF